MLLVNPHSVTRPDIPGVVAHLQAWEAMAKAGRIACLGHHGVPAVPRHFYVQLRTSDVTALSVPPRIAPEVTKQLKVTTLAPAIVALRNCDFCEYAVLMEWFHGAMYFMRCWNKYARTMKL
jgi:hypothetical protein